MINPRFKILDTGDVYAMIYAEIRRVLETAHGPALYKDGYMRLDIRTRDGRCVHPERDLPDNWRDLTFALSALNSVTGLARWTRVFERDDGVVFIVDFGYSVSGEVEYIG